MSQEIYFPPKEGATIVSKTDKTGKITYGNELFIQMSGYTESELLGQPHNILRHPDMPKIVFKHLWIEISAGREVHAYVKNKTKNGDFYWVYTTVNPDFDSIGNITGYYSVRVKPTQSAVQKISEAYKNLMGSDADKKLKEILGGKSYEEFIIKL
ncbi:MAG: PAS domain-containing protein [Candidatus Gracilibacteria bacterium]|nr:PAS domain-containing protein [Candidatus Gracilibacteria bacterium]